MTQRLFMHVVMSPWRQNRYHASQQLLYKVAIYDVARCTGIILLNWAGE